MKKKTKIWLITATALVSLGLLLFLTVMSINGWDFNKVSTEKMQTKTHEISQTFTSVAIETDTADVRIVKAVDGVSKVVCYEEEKNTHTVSVESGVLTVKEIDERAWYEHIGIQFSQPTVTLYLVEAGYTALTVKGSTGDVQIQDFRFDSVDVSISTGDVKAYASVSGLMKIKTSTGDIDVENTSAGGLELSVSTGEIELDSVAVASGLKIDVHTGEAELFNVSCKTLTSSGSTGGMTLHNVIVSETMSIKRSTGDIQFEACDAGEIFIKTDTGYVKGSLLSEKDFVAKSDTGTVKVPSTHTGGKCEISTDTGDIKISIKK